MRTENITVSYSALCADYFAAENRRDECKALEALLDHWLRLNDPSVNHGATNAECDRIHGFAIRNLPESDLALRRIINGLQMVDPLPATYRKQRDVKDDGKLAPKTLRRMVNATDIMRERGLEKLTGNLSTNEQLLRIVVHMNKLQYQIDTCAPHKRERIANLGKAIEALERRAAELAEIAGNQERVFISRETIDCYRVGPREAIPMPTFERHSTAKAVKSSLAPVIGETVRADGAIVRKRRECKVRVYSKAEIDAFAKERGL